MSNVEAVVRAHVQAIGDEAFPDDQVSWAAEILAVRDGHVFAELIPTPNTVGYERYVAVLKSADGASVPSVLACFVLENGAWDALFSEADDSGEWQQVLAGL